jgi:hypothetical protein
MLKKYLISPTRETHEGWALVVIDTDVGFFAVVSDFGNYAYLWTSPGKEFRAFLAGLDADYLCKKLLHGRGDAREFDGDGTKKALFEALEAYEAASWENTGVGWGSYAEEREKLAARTMTSELEYMAWQSETLIPEADEYARYRVNADAAAFCTRVWPRFKEMLERELAQEASDLQGLKEVRPVLKLAVETEIREMTKEKNEHRG